MATTMKLGFAKDDSKWTKTLPAFADAAANISDEDASAFAKQYAKIVDGTLTSAEVVKSTPVAVD